MPIVFKTEEERNPTKPVEENVKFYNKSTPETTDNTKGVYVSGEHIGENLTQIAYSEGEEGQLAIEFLEENGLYTKFLLWQGIKEQLKKLREELAG